MLTSYDLDRVEQGLRHQVIDHHDVRELIDEVRQRRIEAEARDRVMEQQHQRHLAEARDIIPERDTLRKRVEELETNHSNELAARSELVQVLQDAINEYCWTRNTYDVEDHTPYGKAIDRLYELCRESAFRPRVRAVSEVAR